MAQQGAVAVGTGSRRTYEDAAAVRSLTPRPLSPGTDAVPALRGASGLQPSVWRKLIQSLARIEHVTNLGFRCTSPICLFPWTVYRSARAKARQVKGSGYGLDVVALIRQLRFGQHCTREETLRRLVDDTPAQISERHVQNLMDVYLALLRASHTTWRRAWPRRSRSTAG